MPTIIIGDRIKLSRYTAWRSLSPVFEDGDLIAFVGMMNGYGKPWRLFSVALCDKPADGYAGCHCGDRSFNIPNREDAVAAVDRHRPALKTSRELRIAAKAMAEAGAAHEEQRRVDRIARQKQREQRLEGLVSIRNHPLSNFEAAALDEAIIELQNEIGHYAKLHGIAA
jgi:predicted  nucleic acid-binding Zn-ribbon protein